MYTNSFFVKNYVTDCVGEFFSKFQAGMIAYIFLFFKNYY